MCSQGRPGRELPTSEAPLSRFLRRACDLARQALLLVTHVVRFHRTHKPHIRTSPLISRSFPCPPHPRRPLNPEARARVWHVFTSNVTTTMLQGKQPREYRSYPLLRHRQGHSHSFHARAEKDKYTSSNSSSGSNRSSSSSSGTNRIRTDKGTRSTKKEMPARPLTASVRRW